MSDVEIRFEREGAEGIVAVGSYLFDAAKRFGVKFDEACRLSENEHFCAVTVTEGSDLLSEETFSEKEYYADHPREDNERLACQTRIEKPGEIVIMTKKKKKEPVSEEESKEHSEEYRKQFAELPLDKKITELVQLEALALGETLVYLANSPYKIADKIMDVMAGFGFKMEQEKKEAAKPVEHRSNGASEGKEAKEDKVADEAKAETT